MEAYDNTRSYTGFLRDRAEQMNVTLPPLGKTPRRWSKSLRTPQGTPPELSAKPFTFIRRLLRLAWRPIALQTLLMTVSSVGGALVPYLMGTMINGLIEGGFDAYTRGQALWFVLLIVLISAAEGIGQLSGIATWMGGSMIATWAVGRRVSRAGRAAKSDTPAGEVVTAMVNDSDHLGGAFVWLPELISNLAAAIVVVVIMFRVSVPLGWVVALGVPAAIALVTLLARPLQDKLAIQREEQGKLTGISTDAVAGLRVLRGIGGEAVYNERYRAQSQKVRAAGVAAASNQAALVVLRNSTPQLLIAAVIGYGAYLVFHGQLNAGNLVAFYGYALYMRMPIGTASAIVQHWTRGWVGAKKLAAAYATEPEVNDEQVDPTLPEPQWLEADLRDRSSGVSVPAGQLTAVVSSSPERAAEVARRLARISDEDESAVSLDGVDLRAYPLETVRQGIYLSESSPQLFRESLQSAILGADAPEFPLRGVTELVYREHVENFAREEDTLFQPEPVDRTPRLDQAIWAAAATDVEASMDWGLAGELTEKGRNISGGQRQRVALARALYAKTPILVLVEPTSAVDAHTESQIAARLRQVRSGRTTVVVTTSPLLLAASDRVVVLDQDGKELGEGTHEQLWEGSGQAADQYRQIISREVSGA